MHLQRKKKELKILIVLIITDKYLIYSLILIDYVYNIRTDSALFLTIWMYWLFIIVPMFSYIMFYIQAIVLN